MRTADVAVIGVGITGAAATYALARRGVDVIALERFEIGHRNGSSHGASRIFRFSYPDARYVRMAQRSLGLWRALEDESEQDLVKKMGGLDLGRSLDDHAAALEACGADHEILRGAEVMERWPLLDVPRDARVLFQPDAGIAYADRAWRAFVDRGRAHGAVVEEGTKVTGFESDGDGVVVSTEKGSVRAKTAVVSAGPWARPLLMPLGIDLPVTPSIETVAYFALDGAQELPSLVDWGDPAVFSLASPEPSGLKVGLHHAGPAADPDAPQGPSRPTVEKVATWAQKRFPAARPDPIGVETCFYTNTSDETFIFERRGPVVIGSPCSGHGFKFAPLTGERLAALALGEPAP